MKLLVENGGENAILQSLLKMWGDWFCCSIRNVSSEWAQKKKICKSAAVFGSEFAKIPA